jgi:hypothetical protein
MGGVDKRLTVLEQLAEQVRLRPYRILAEERGIPFDTLMVRVEQIRAKNARLRAEGKSEREIVELTAADIGVSPDALQRKAEELMERFG